MKILLVEPNYKNKLPPLGLMKIARYHRLLGDNVFFVKGLNSSIRNDRWDRIYITSLFSFYWKITIETIAYYKNSVQNPSNVFVGGIMASILYNELKTLFPEIMIHKGLLDQRNILDKNNIIIDALPPDYSILDFCDYKYPLRDYYICHATRGCINKCKFCAVPSLEPTYKDYVSFNEHISYIKSEHGPKTHLLFLDNNVLASTQFKTIIQTIIDVGFNKGAKLDKRNRYVDFNQGLDPRLIDNKKMELLSSISIRPLRVAFDSIKLEKIYTTAIRLAAKHNILHLSNYILYNYNDTPHDFYRRLEINTLLNEELGTKIYSFPMKYIPTNEVDRQRHIGKHWTWKMIRGVQCILNATHGIVGLHHQYFNKAFGSTPDEFVKIINMPERYIIYRLLHEANGAKDWSNTYDTLNTQELNDFISIIASDKNHSNMNSENKRIKQLISHYR